MPTDRSIERARHGTYVTITLTAKQAEMVVAQMGRIVQENTNAPTGVLTRNLITSARMKQAKAVIKEIERAIHENNRYSDQVRGKK
jgi:hypothetical protein